MPHQQKQAQPAPIEFFVVLQALMSSHPDKELVNRLHRLALNEPSVREAYMRGAWESFGRKAPHA